MFNMLKWFKNLFGIKQEKSDFYKINYKDFKVSNGITVETDDQLMADVATRAFLSGNMVIGNRDEDGNETIKEIKQ